MKTKLKPCPFCGHEWVTIIRDESSQREWNSHTTVWWYVYCPDCLADGPTSYDSEKEAIELWNKRIKE